jgi:hypothetical protein
VCTRSPVKNFNASHERDAVVLYLSSTTQASQATEGWIHYFQVKGNDDKLLHCIQSKERLENSEISMLLSLLLIPQ